VKLGPTLAATLACALAFGAANSPAVIAPQGGVGALAVAPQGGRVLVGIDGGRPGSWLFASDDAGTTWRTARGMAGSAGVTAIAFAPGNRLIAYAGVIKAFHWHRRQWDIWFFASGMAQTVLHDLREGSPTCGRTDHTTERYDPDAPDEERIPFDDPRIGFDWRTKNR